MDKPGRESGKGDEETGLMARFAYTMVEQSCKHSPFAYTMAHGTYMLRAFAYTMAEPSCKQEAFVN